MKQSRLLMVSLGCLALIAGNSDAASFKCWTNSDGVRECGNVVPPEYSQEKTETLNDRGITIGVQKRAKTKEEIQKEEAEKSAREAAQKAAAERERKQAAYDQMLLNTFTTEQELIASRDRKVAAFNATIEVTDAAIDNMNHSMKEYRVRAANLERAGRPLPEDLKNDIVGLQQQVGEKKAYIKAQQEEIAKLKEKYQKDLERFRELKAAGR